MLIMYIAMHRYVHSNSWFQLLKINIIVQLEYGVCTFSRSIFEKRKNSIKKYITYHVSIPVFDSNIMAIIRQNSVRYDSRSWGNWLIQSFINFLQPINQQYNNMVLLVITRILVGEVQKWWTIVCQFFCLPKCILVST